MLAAPTLPMLKEWDVILAVCKHLSERGCEVVNACWETKRGDDITGWVNNKQFTIEAKGETSSKESKRAGKQFTSAQVNCHVSMAFARAASRVNEQMFSAVAFPDNKHHRLYVGRLATAFERLGITVFWVAGDLVVRVDDYGCWGLPGLPFCG